nr:immunoglobulin light chain junction region [Macaca mulatta]MOX11009.1 immunoglobulin light chain junction region [Macaca mulatta]
CQQGNSYPYSF